MYMYMITYTELRSQNTRLQNCQEGKTFLGQIKIKYVEKTYC